MKRTVWMTLGIATILVSTWAAASRTAVEPGGSDGRAAVPTADWSVAAAGRVEALSDEIELGAEIPGRLVSVLVDEGDTVRAGQVLARIDAADHRARLDVAGARLAMARAEYDRLQNGARSEERREAEAARVAAETALVQAENELARREKLYAAGAVSLEEYERAATERRVALARFDQAAERAQLIDADARADETARAVAAITLAEAEVAAARATLAKTEIRAPRGGVILRRHREAGEIVAPEPGASLVFTMADTSALRVRVDVDETDIARLVVGRRAWVSADAFGDRRFFGTVVDIGQMLGRKNVRTDDPTEKNDTKILEVLVNLDADVRLPVGLRVDAFIQ